jgi:hypothetical protein
MGRQAPSLPSDLKAAIKRFEEWRATRTGRSRIPESLWSLAVSMAKTHGIWRVAKALRVNYEGLKRRVTAKKSPTPKEESFSPFVELDLSRSFHPKECIIELEERDGPKMTIHLKGTDSIDVIGLSKSFFGRGR